MTDREVEAARAVLHRQRADVRRCVAAGLAAAVLTVVLTAAGTRWAVASAVAAAVLAAMALVRSRQRAGLLDRLALDPSAYAIGDVERHGRSAAGRTQRRRLAFRLETVLRGGELAAVAEAERVSRYRRELVALTRCIASPDVRIAPPQAVACRRLLTRCAESPLYNEHVPAEDLGAALRRISAGVSAS